MTIREPKCIRWKRKGAERVASLTADMSHEQELEFWNKKTEALRVRQNRQKKVLGRYGS